MKMMRHVWFKKSPAWPKKKYFRVLTKASKTQTELHRLALTSFTK